MRVLALPVLLLVTALQQSALPLADAAIRHNNLGAALMDAGTKDPKYLAEAVREFEAALRVAPEYDTARLNLGVALYYAGQTSRAESTLTSVLNRRPDSLHAHFVFGLLRETEGQFEAAARHFKRVADRDASDADAWYHLGFCLSRTQRHAESVEAFRRAAQLLPYQRRVRYGLFMALTRAGRRAEAETELDAFRALDGSQVRVIEGPKNTMEYLKQGRYAEAVAESRRPAPPPSPPQYADVARQSGISTRPLGRDAEIDSVLRGEAKPASWFAVAENRRRLSAAAGVSAAMIDYNADGRLDVHLTRAGGGQHLFAQRAAGRFADVTGATGIAAGLSRPVAVAWGDLDNDGQTDMVAAEVGRLAVMMNRRGRFRLVPSAPALNLGAGYVAAGLSLADVDHDGDLDIAVAGGADLARPRPSRTLRFPDDFEPRPNLLLQNNRDGTFTDIAGRAGVARSSAPALAIWFSDVDDDRAVDMVLVGARGRHSVLLNRKNGTFAPAAETFRLPNPPQITPGQASAYGDFNRNGAVDELVVNAAGVKLNRNQRRPSRWLTVRAAGYTAPGKVKSNRLGIGTRIEVRSAGLWERREIRAGNGMGGVDAAEVTFELGDQGVLDFVRGIFPSGVRKTVTNTPSGQVLLLEEPLLDVNSCPTLFTWNGRRFEFITDTLSAGILGELVGPGQYWDPDPDEWVRVAPGRLVSRDGGSLEIRFTNPLEEVTYLDHGRLVAVDHPASMDVYSDERMRGPSADRSSVQVFGVEGRQPVANAHDHHGHDVTESLARMDRRFFDHFAPLPFKGFAGDWSLTLDLGDAGRDARSPVVGLEGWSYWNSSAAIVAASQAGERLWGPVLDVQDETGRWRLATDDLGLPAGLPRTVMIDLSPYLRRGEHVIRLRANRTIYYDQVWVGHASARALLGAGTRAETLRETAVPLRDARLRWLGYPTRRLDDGSLPEVFDYQDLESDAEWGTHAGWLTRYGDVRPLVSARDSRFVVMGHGEEIALSFDGAALPPLPPDMRRTFFFYSNGFEKGNEVHSAHADTVDPLPYHGMRGYPGDSARARGDPGFFEYVFEWNTRPAFMRPHPAR